VPAVIRTAIVSINSLSFLNLFGDSFDRRRCEAVIGFVTMSTTTIIIIVVVLLLLFGGGGYFYRRGR
jgi:hypothetical protein